MIKTLCDLCKKADTPDCPIFSDIDKIRWNCLCFEPDITKIEHEVKLEMYKNGTIKEALRGNKSNEN